MKADKRRKLEANGWSVTNADDFLELTSADRSYLDLRQKLARGLREQRKAVKLTQVVAAKKMRTSQSRLAKMEAGDPSVSVDLLVNAYFALGADTAKLAKLIAR